MSGRQVHILECKCVEGVKFRIGSWQMTLPVWSMCISYYHHRRHQRWLCQMNRFGPHQRISGMRPHKHNGCMASFATSRRIGVCHLCFQYCIYKGNICGFFSMWYTCEKRPDKVMSQRILLIKTGEMFHIDKMLHPDCKRPAALLKDEKIYTKKKTCNEAVQFSWRRPLGDIARIWLIVTPCRLQTAGCSSPNCLWRSCMSAFHIGIDMLYG